MISKFKTIPNKKSKVTEETKRDSESYKTVDFGFRDVVLDNDDAQIDFSKHNPYFELKKRPSTSAAPSSIKVRPVSSISLLSNCNI